MFQNTCAPVLKSFPLTTIVNGTLFVGALFGTNELIARGPVIAVVKVALVAAGPPHAAMNKIRQQILERYIGNFMTQPAVSGYTRDVYRALACPELFSAHFSVEVAGCPNVSLTTEDSDCQNSWKWRGCLDRLDYLQPIKIAANWQHPEKHPSCA